MPGRTLYPASDLDRPRTIAGLLGSFWATVYGGADQVRGYAGGLGRAFAQVHDDLVEAADCVSYRTVPVLHREAWTVAYLRRGATPSDAAVPSYGGGHALGDGLNYGYALPAAGSAYASATPARVPVIANRQVDPTRVLVEGLDYLVAPGRLTFRVDPVDDGAWGTRPVFDASGALVDTELAVWLYGAGSDRDYLNTHHAYLLGLTLPATEGAASLLRAALDAVVGGTAREQVEALLEAVTGVPLCGSDGERVEVVARDDRGLLVCTDRRAYRLPAASSPLVAPGDVLAAGGPLCDALRVDELNRGTVPDGLTALGLPRGLTPASRHSEVVFEDRDVPLVVDEADPSGRTRVSFALGGFPADVEEFWDRTHAAGVAEGRTLADLLDPRADPMNEPTAAVLPATVNPLGFLLRNVLRGNAFLIRIRAGALGAGAAGLHYLRLLRLVVPPQTCPLVILDMAAAADSIKMDQEAATLRSCTAPEPLAGSIAFDPGWDRPGRPRNVSRTCY